jgi:hypothetical protein
MKRLILSILLWWLGVVTVVAHPALYHYVEINLNEPGKIRVYLTLHAPELSDEVLPLEKDMFGADWLAGLGDSDIADLVANAYRFGDEKFSFLIDGQPLQLALTFPSADEIRRPPVDSQVPAGCFSGVAELNYAGGKKILTVDFSEAAEKRLMLVINRPVAFPEVFDVEPGASRDIVLPEAPAEMLPDLAIPVPAERGAEAFVPTRMALKPILASLMMVAIAAYLVYGWKSARR